ncbi:hypothetical protein BpHYR1_024970 [Brachionus plicatilis]|uniref:SWIM-type domain-containing protein n=1 Tax=Brachionus plicatilis TaxID=10195 RepID=A0A3M7SA47_BRAPC|nr:hypothetical protein BpHYR1_024970 [Brachionus plicatilis]
MATEVIQDNTVSSSSENVLDYQDTSDDVDSEVESETLHRKRKRSKGQAIGENNESIIPYNAGIMDGSCRWYIKNNICKHLIGISKILNILGCEIPLSAKNIPIGVKRKPAKAKQAFIV